MTGVGRCCRLNLRKTKRPMLTAAKILSGGAFKWRLHDDVTNIQPSNIKPLVACSNFSFQYGCQRFVADHIRESKLSEKKTPGDATWTEADGPVVNAERLHACLVGYRQPYYKQRTQAQRTGWPIYAVLKDKSWDRLVQTQLNCCRGSCFSFPHISDTSHLPILTSTQSLRHSMFQNERAAGPTTHEIRTIADRKSPDGLMVWWSSIKVAFCLSHFAYSLFSSSTIASTASILPIT